VSNVNRTTSRLDIDPLLEGWEPGPSGAVIVRVVTDEDGVEYLQRRLDLGVLQLCIDGRPDGERPFERESLLDHYQQQNADPGSNLTLSEEDLESLDAEIMQYYHRRIGLLAVASQAQASRNPEQAVTYYRRAARDAEHNIGIMDLIAVHAADANYIAEHEHFRPFVLCHLTLAESQAEALTGRVDEAIERIKAGIELIRELVIPENDEDDEIESDGNDAEMFVQALEQLDQELRRQYGIDRTLREQLADAVENEDYEQAAKLRDLLRQQDQDGRLKHDGADLPDNP